MTDRSRTIPENGNIDIKSLEIESVFGFNGTIPSGLKVHPDQNHLIFGLGNKVSVMNLSNNSQTLLTGHTHVVSALDVSPLGNKLASGQVSHMGFCAYVIIWDWKTKTEYCRHELHKERIESLTFTACEKYLITLGGRDDGQVLVWNVPEKTAVCISMATKQTTGFAMRVCKLMKRDLMFVSAGVENLRFWCINEETKRLIVHDVIVGRFKRIYTGMCVNHTDDLMYVGTMSGDIMKIKLNCNQNVGEISREKPPVLLGSFGRHNSKRPAGKDCEKYSNGVRELVVVSPGRLLIGTGDGTLELVEERNVTFKDYPQPTWPQLKTIRSKRISGAITGIDLMNCNFAIVGTVSSEIYLLNLSTFDVKLLRTCHTSAVYDIAFPRKFSAVFATASQQSLRIWSIKSKQELLRIVVPNFVASAVIFSPDGKSLISAWNDGVIRAFTPLTGRLMYSILNAHNKGVSALSISSNGRVLISGGTEGQVRIWKIEPHKQSLVGVLKEHAGPVGTVHINRFDNEVITSSSDCTCIIWDIVRMCRKHVLYANTQFTCARFLPSGVQVLTTGSDRRISYWEAYDGSLVRDVEGSTKGTINCIDINSTGEYFVSVGNDQIVKLWHYNNGLPVAAGYGHAANVTVGKYSPCGKYLVTGSADGGTIIWKVPVEYHITESDVPSSSKISSASSKKSIASAKSVKSNKSKKTDKENLAKLETKQNSVVVHDGVTLKNGK